MPHPTPPAEAPPAPLAEVRVRVPSFGHGPANSPPGRRRAHARDVIRLREIERLTAEGVTEDEALRRVMLDPKIGLKTYLQDPARLDRPGEVARALGALLERGAPAVLERVRLQAETSLAASAADFTDALKELARGEGLRTRDDAAVGRVRVEAAVAALGVLGMTPRGGKAPLVEITNVAATQAHVASAREAEAFEKILGAFIEAVEALLAHVPEAIAVEEASKIESATGIRVRVARRVEAVAS